METGGLKTRRLLWPLVVCAVVVGLAVWLAPRQSPQTAIEPFPIPPYSATRFLNTGPDAHYIGTAACAECHHGNHQSYVLTAHSRALADLDPNAEPPDGSFDHKASGHGYRVFRRDKQLRHAEIVRSEDGEEIARIDVPVRYRIGSGDFARSYAVEIDGYLYESPITWYASTKQWGLSPGYDTPQHWGFERPIQVECLACHSGRAEAAQGTLHRITVHEQAIGCENCHGPGSRHEAARRVANQTTDVDDLTIVNPGKLARPHLEAICAACHLNGPAAAPVRGRRSTDFRPGMLLTDYRVDYTFDTGSDKMTVVGHIEQLRRSACYQKSQDLTCISCHDPHALKRPKDMAESYRQKCLNCHGSRGCLVDQAQRLKEDATDNCMRCHMPRGDTEVPHVAFTNHRIVRRVLPRGLGVEGVPDLVPTDDISHLPPLDQQRNLGLAYLAAYRNPEYSQYAGVFWDRARNLLEGVRAAGLREGETASALAELYWTKDRDRALDYALQAAEAKALVAEARLPSLIVMAGHAVQERNFRSAIRSLDEILVLRRSAEDWRYLGVCYLEEDQADKALPVLHKALALRPYRPSVHAGLAEAYRRLGKADLANEHLKKAQWLSLHHQD